MADNTRPIVIKRVIKKGGDGHHGGAWKVAYADFVTAMMAFFLLMWLLNATTEVQRKGIADYFHPTIAINRISGGGDGAFGGDSIFSEESLAQNGTGATNRNSTESNRARGETGTDSEDGRDQEEIEMRGLEEELTGRTGESMVSNEAAKHIITEVTDEGLIVELFDLPDTPLFFPGTARPTPIMLELIDTVSSVFVMATNDLAINNYLSSLPLVIAEDPSWDLSSARGHAVREALVRGAFPDRRVQRVTGYSDRKPVMANPMSFRNNRTEIILLRNLE